VFPKEMIAAPYRWIDIAYNIVQRTEMPKGGHFAALEQPDLLIKDITDVLCAAQAVVALGLASG
jgi:pimeloyl-ACP methyl ester carboxylesterase